MKLPHTNVYSRIGVSSIHGVGLIAIIDIPKGTYLFTGDISEMIWYRENELKLQTVPEKIKKLYDDFCVIIHKDGVKMFGCPDSFNNLTMSWYLNNSNDPNVACDKEYNFYTIRDIKEGEELTVDYSTYSEE